MEFDDLGDEQDLFDDGNEEEEEVEEDYGDADAEEVFGSGDEAAKENRDANNKKLLESVWKKSEKRPGATTSGATTRKARPRLSERELIGPKGLPALKQMFDGYQLSDNKGAYENMSRILKRMEYWAHGLYPQFNFDDFLEKTETIGRNRLIKLTMTKLRLGLSLDDSDEIIQEKDTQDDGENFHKSPEPANSKKPVSDEEHYLNDSFYEDDDYGADLQNEVASEHPTTATVQSQTRKSPARSHSRAELEKTQEQMDNDSEDEILASNTKLANFSSSAKRRGRAVMSDDEDGFGHAPGAQEEQETDFHEKVGQQQKERTSTAKLRSNPKSSCTEEIGTRKKSEKRKLRPKTKTKSKSKRMPVEESCEIVDFAYSDSEGEQQKEVASARKSKSKKSSTKNRGSTSKIRIVISDEEETEEGGFGGMALMDDIGFQVTEPHATPSPAPSPFPSTSSGLNRPTSHMSMFTEMVCHLFSDDEDGDMPPAGQLNFVRLPKDPYRFEE